jgi:hypothetical protein
MHRKAGDVEKVTNKITETLYLSNIDFTKEVSGGSFKIECNMLPILKKSILDSSLASSINIIPSDTIAMDQYELKVEYIDVVPQKWGFMAFRPGSNATVRASILKDGAVLHTTTKQIGSGAAFGTCDRLDKISLAEGMYISKWLSKYI